MTSRIARRSGAWWAAGPALALVGVLAGCADGGPVQGALDGMSAAFRPAPEAPPPPLPVSYCYRTLGTVDCYSQPLPGSEANRLVGYQGPPPRASSGTGPLSP